MTEQDMVERGAEALGPWIPNDPAAHEAAVAFLEAMREPSKEMIKAGRAEILSDSLVEDAADVWRAMIDKALGR